MTGTASLLPNGEQQFIDGDGVPYALGTVEFYIPTTLTPKNTWQDANQSVLNTNPVVLDAAGRAIIYGSGQYRQILRDSLGNLVWDQLTDAPLTSQDANFFTGGTSTGSANAQVLTPLIPSGLFSLSHNGDTVMFTAGATNTGATTFNVDGTGATTVLKDSTSGPIPLTGGEIVAGNSVELTVNTTSGALILGAGTIISPSRSVLAANADYYVATTGNDSNPGTLASPFLTLQHAANVVYGLDLNGNTVTIHVADGTYAAGVTFSNPFTGAGTVILQGNTTTPANCIISVTSAQAITAQGGAHISVLGFKLTTAVSGIGLFATDPGTMIKVTGLMEYGAMAGGSTKGAISAANYAEILITANYVISGGGGFVYNVSTGNIISNSVTVTVSGTPAFSAAFAVASNLGQLIIENVTFSGSATGTRFNDSTNANIQTATNGNLTYFPGNVAGVLTSSAVYDNLIGGAFTPSFTSSETTVSVGQVDFAHGLGVVPSLFTIVARCKTNDNGYVVGDEIDLTCLNEYPGGAGGSPFFMAVSAGATNITLSTTDTDSFIVSTKSGGGDFVIANTNWKLVARAWV